MPVYIEPAISTPYQFMPPTGLPQYVLVRDSEVLSRLEEYLND